MWDRHNLFIHRGRCTNPPYQRRYIRDLRFSSIRRIEQRYCDGRQLPDRFLPVLSILHGRLLPRRQELRHHFLSIHRQHRRGELRRHGCRALHFDDSGRFFKHRHRSRSGGDARLLCEWVVHLRGVCEWGLLSFWTCLRGCELYCDDQWASGYWKGGT